MNLSPHRENKSFLSRIFGTDYIRELYPEIQTFRNSRFAVDDDPEFGRFLKNKRIAVVGPARTLLGKNLGAFIDSFDIVVRFNDIFELLPFTQELSTDIGTRMDIVYCNQVVLRKNILKRKESIQHSLLYNCSRAGVKFIVCTNNSLDFLASGESGPTCPKKDRRIVSDFKTLLERIENTMRFRIVYEVSKTLSKWLGGNWARTGLVGIMDLLRFDVSLLYVTGMTFYHGGGHLLSGESTELHPLKNRDGTWAKDTSGVGHDSYRELKLMKMLKQSLGEKLEVDEDLQALMKSD